MSHNLAFHIISEHKSVFLWTSTWQVLLKHLGILCRRMSKKVYFSKFLYNTNGIWSPHTQQLMTLPAKCYYLANIRWHAKEHVFSLILWFVWFIPSKTYPRGTELVLLHYKSPVVLQIRPTRFCYCKTPGKFITFYRSKYKFCNTAQCDLKDWFPVLPVMCILFQLTWP